MKITIPRRELKTALIGLGKIVPRHTALPVLSGVKFEVAADVKAVATDLDQMAIYRFGDAVSNGSGSFVIPHADLKDLGKGADADVIEIAVNGDYATISNPVAGQVITRQHQLLSLDDWPALTATVKTTSADGFLETIQKLAPFVSSDTTRAVLNGCFLDVSEPGKGKARMVATDGRRLTCCNTMTLPLSESCVIPVSKYLTWLDGTCAIGVHKTDELSWFGVEAGPWKYIVKTIDGTYPNYRQVIPAERGGNRVLFAEADVERLPQILKALPGDREGVVVFRPAGEVVTVSGKAKENPSETTVTLSGGSRYVGKCGQIALSRHYLLDALKAGFREFTFADDISPLLSEDGHGGKHVVMPMRVEPVVNSLASKIVEAQQEEIAVSADTKHEVNEAEEKKTRRTKMSKEATAVEKLLAAYEAAKEQLKTVQSTVADLAGLIKEVAREDKTRRSEVEAVRSSLAKIQAIRV
jgi:DNA polymerase III subunit beta